MSRTVSYTHLDVYKRQLQGFLHAFAAADLDEQQMGVFRDTLAGLRKEAEDRRVPEVDRRFGRGRRQHTGVHAMMPEIETLELDDDHFLGTTMIGDFYLGVNSCLLYTSRCV